MSCVFTGAHEVKQGPPPRQQQLLALVPPTVALAVQWTFWSSLQPQVFVLFYPAVIASSWMGGLRGGVAGTAFAAVLIWFFFVPRQLSFVIEEPRMMLGLGVFSGLGVLFSVLNERLRSVNQSLEERVAQRTMELEASRKSIEYSEARMTGIVGSAMDAIISVDSGQTIILFNAAAETMFRCSAAEALNQPLDRFIPQRFREAHKQHVKGFGQTSHTSRSMRSLGTLSGVRANGDEFPIEASISQVEVAGQKVYTVILRDITLRKKDAEATALLAAIVESSGDAIVGKDLNSIVTSWNAGAEDMFGYSASEMVGCSITQIIPPDRQHEELMIMDRIKRGERVEHFETMRLVKGGGLLAVSVTVSPIKDAQGKVIGASKVVRNITERQRAEEALRASEAEFRASFYSAAVGKAQVNPHTGQYLRVNAKLCEITGYSEEELLRMTFVDLTHPDDRADDKTAHESLTRGDVPGISLEKRYVGKDGRIVWVNVSTSLIRDEDGEPVRTLAVIQDITARREAEEALRESEARFTKVFRSNPAAICITTMQDGRFIEVNEHYCQLFDLKREELIGQTSVMLALWDDPATRIMLMKRLQGHELVRDYETRFRRKGGGLIDAVISMELIDFPDEQEPVVVSMFADITERKQAAAAIVQEQERFRTMANSMSQLAWIARPDGFIFWYNQRWYDYTGTTPEQMEGWGWQSVHDPEVLPTVMRNWSGAIAARQLFEMEFPLRGSDGKFRAFLTRGQPLKDAAGEVLQWFGTNTDVEALRESEEKIRQLNAELEQRVIERTAELEAVNAELLSSRAELKSLFESLPGLYLVLTPDFKIVAASDAYLDATLTTREGILGRGVFEVFPDNPDDPTADGVSNIRASLERVLHSGVADTVAIQKYDVRRPDGSFEEHYWSPVNSPLLDADGCVRHIIHRVEEVTDFVRHKQQSTQHEEALSARLQQMEAEVFLSAQKIQAANKLLEAANKELESFSYSVSHDLRAPLRAMDGFSRAVLEDYGPQLPEDGQRYLNIIRSNSQKMGALIDDLLMFSRLSRTPMSKQRIDTAALVQSALNELSPQLEGRQIDLRIEPLPKCVGDPALLKQVWVNLLSNACKYSRKRAQAVIEIGCRAEDGANAYFVRDNGAGFDMRYAHKLFGVFQRLHRAEDYEGTGVGLAIVQRVIHRHGGRVWAESILDQGTTFHFTLEEQPAS